MTQPIRLPDTLADGIIVLNGYTLSDAQAHWEGEDVEMLRRFGASERATLHHTLNVIRRWMDSRTAGTPNFCYAIRISNGSLAGGCEVRWLALRPQALNISYWCYPQFRGRGFVRRAIVLILGVVSATGAKQIEAHIDADNLASRRVAERAGFIQDGTVVDETASGEGTITRIRYVRTP